MAEIKSLAIFGANKGLKKIEIAENVKKKKKEIDVKEEDKDSSELPVSETPVKEEQLQTSEENRLAAAEEKAIPDVSGGKKKRKKGAGAPIRNFDRVYTTSQSVKLSALLNSTLRVLTSKYMTGESKDDILRKALNDYVKHNLTKEDKQDMLNDLQKDLSLFRIKNPTLDEVNENGEIILTAKQVEEKTMKDLERSLGLK